MTSIMRDAHRPLGAAIAMVLGLGTASASTITVTTGGDSGSAGTCTLRQAINSANLDNAGSSSCVAGSGADTIQFAGALANSTVTLTQGQLAITTPLTIAGSNQTIDANYQSRILQISSTVSASNLTLTHGYSRIPAQGYSGGGINAFNSVLTLSNVTFDHNKAASYGGALQVNHTTLDMTDVTVSNNQSTGLHGFYSGGGLNINGNCAVNLVRTKITGNTARSGAALYISYSTSLTMFDSTISGNTAQYGGALTAVNAGTVSFIDSTISGNSATISAGSSTAVGGALIVDTAALSLVNVTMTGNTADEGGAMYLSTGASATFTNTTVSANTARTMGGGGVWTKGGTLTFSNTLFAGNTATGNPAQADVKQVGGTLTATYSLLGTALDTAPLNTAANHNVFSDAPLLGPLANNGGIVQTMALLAGSAALGAGSIALAVDATNRPLDYDARGVSFLRVFNGTVDIGAFEQQRDRLFANGFEAPP